MVINVEIGALEHEILVTALYSLKRESEYTGNKHRACAIQAFITKLGI